MQTSGDNSHVTSLSWVQDGPYMAVGTSDHKVQIWDVEKLKQVRSMSGHRARVSSLSWNGPVLSSGGRDSVVMHHDVRVADHKVGTLRGHAQEVCGLKWSPSGTQLASGGNDNILNLWDDRYTSSANGVCDQPLLRPNRQTPDPRPPLPTHPSPPRPPLLSSPPPPSAGWSSTAPPSRPSRGARGSGTSSPRAEAPPTG